MRRCWILDLQLRLWAAAESEPSFLSSSLPVLFVPIVIRSGSAVGFLAGLSILIEVVRNCLVSALRGDDRYSLIVSE